MTTGDVAGRRVRVCAPGDVADGDGLRIALPGSCTVDGG